MKCLPLTIATLLALPFGTGTTLAESLLATADGKWSGGGWARQTMNDPKRKTKCRLSFVYSAQAQTLSITGKCAGGGRAVSVDGQLSESPDGQFSGRWKASDGSSVSMFGVQDGDVIWLNWTDKNPKTQKPETFWGRWKISAQEISMSSGNGSTRSRQLSQLDLARN